MASGVKFQSGTLASPPAGTVIATDEIINGGVGTHWQYAKLDVGPAGTAVPLHYAVGTGLPVAGIGTFQVLGSIQTVGTSQVLGSVQTVGTSQILGTVQPRAPVFTNENFFGTMFTGNAATNGTLVPAPGAGTFVRVYDIIVSGSAAGTAFLEFGDGTSFGPVILAANGGLSFNSYKGVRTKAANLDILFNYAAGSWGVSINYTLET